jgi:hypothetical protein
LIGVQGELTKGFAQTQRDAPDRDSIAAKIKRHHERHAQARRGEEDFIGFCQVR